MYTLLESSAQTSEAHRPLCTDLQKRDRIFQLIPLRPLLQLFYEPFET